MKKLDNHIINNELQNLQGWKYSNEFLEKDFVFANFKDALSNMIRIGFEAESMNHHPIWTNVYNKLNIRLNTHDIGGVTEKDILLAKKIETIIKSKINIQ
jgi:4a-hydroxytetrahydrobiopterin dehydratase